MNTKPLASNFTASKHKLQEENKFQSGKSKPSLKGIKMPPGKFQVSKMKFSPQTSPRASGKTSFNFTVLQQNKK